VYKCSLIGCHITKKNKLDQIITTSSRLVITLYQTSISLKISGFFFTNLDYLNVQELYKHVRPELRDHPFKEIQVSLEIPQDLFLQIFPEKMLYLHP